MSHRILVVDDECLIADTLSLILRRSGYECRTAYDVEEALAIAAHFAPHLIITDVIMPKMNGLELLRESRRLPRCPAVLVISGNAEAAVILEREMLPAKHVRFESKPLGPPAMLALIKVMIKNLGV
jgi:CheY-like chemotaxis protein